MRFIVKILNIFSIYVVFFMGGVFLMQGCFVLLSKIDMFSFISEYKNISSLLSTLFASVISLLYFKRKGYINLKNEFGSKIDLRGTLYVLLLGVSMYYILDYLSYYITQVIGGFYKESYSLEGDSLLIKFISAVLVAPFFEELIFRGVIFRFINRKYSFFISSLLSSLFFSAIHFDKYAFASILIGSMIYCWVYSKSNNIVLCMILHMINNLLTLILYTHKEVFIIDIFSSKVTVISLLLIACLAFLFSLIKLGRRYPLPKDNPWSTT